MKQRRSRLCYGVRSSAFYRSAIGSGNNTYKDPLTKEWKACDRTIEGHKYWSSKDEKWYIQDALNWYIKKVGITHLLLVPKQILNNSVGRDCR